MFETPKIDVHGMRAEQACYYARNALAAFHSRGYPEVYIVHGRGQGILRAAIREMLKYTPYVKKIRSGKDGEGGDGVTVVLFKD